MMEKLALLVEDSIEHFANENKGSLPQNIIMYRDGVSEGQVQNVLKTEVSQIKVGFNNIKEKLKMESYSPKFAEFIVTKKISDRFFYKNDQNKFENPSSGMVVADDIVSKDQFDFYLVA